MNMHAYCTSSRRTVWLSLISGAIAGALIMALANRKRSAEARQDAAAKLPTTWWPC
jgi:uncharacterized membrane protein